MIQGYWRGLVMAIFVCTMFGAGRVSARAIHVSKLGNNSNTGSQASPYLTINQAAAIASPGDTVTVHAGTYREWVKPVRGGTSEQKRITYRVAPGDEVYIKGSERITTWEKQDSGIWKVVIPNSFFDNYNPYALKVSGGWLNYGQWHHRGDVYLNGEAYYEKESADEVAFTNKSWYCQVDEKVTTILANFGEVDPNKEMAEINVRESLFMPETSGLKYITVDGFHFEHAAPNWAPPVIELQTGAVGPRMGKCWIIENCTIINSRCVGIILGQAPGVDYADIDAFGDHIIRNNIIQRCGQAGIAGQRGATRSLISGNLIEETNVRKEFGGWETAAIKFHHSVDTVIENNLIRGVYHQKQGAFGIWIDYGNQGTRITRNIICATQAATVFLEMNHGPILVDNNILVGKDVRSNSEATVFAHNLFVDCGYSYRPDLERQSSYYTPHTLETAGRKPGTAQDDKWFNNIFIRKGLDDVKEAPGFVSNYNIFLEGAKKSAFGDLQSVVDSFDTKFNRKDSSNGVTVSFFVQDEHFPSSSPWVDDDLVGVFPTVGQTIEDRYGNALTVDTDFAGEKRSQPLAGPLANRVAGSYVIEWKALSRE
ncbi:right-handed parallel beta-helix repeat-containing protein [Planctomycetota bacterium]